MGVLPILQQGRDVPVCLPNRELPDFYMADYSILGLLVTSLDKAMHIFAEKDIEMHIKSDHLAVNVDNAAQMSEIVNLLNQNGIDCRISDIVDQVYQG